MVDEVHQGLPSVAYGRRYARVLDASLRRHGARALATALAVLAFLSFVLYTGVLSILPAYPAVLIAFLVWAVLPGWLLQRALFEARGANLAERVTVSFLLSMALAAAPGLLVLQLHWSLDAFATLYAVVAAAASGLALLWPRDEAEAAAEEPAGTRAAVPLLAVLTVALLAVLTAPAWGGDDIARDADDLVYSAYVKQYVDSDALDSSRLFFGAREGAFGRMSTNVWVVGQALLADSAGVEPFNLLVDYLPPLLTVLAVAAAFTLARGLFRNTTVALLAGLFVLGYGALDLSPHEGFGRNVFLRIGEDKMAGSFVLLPVGVLLLARFASEPNVRRYLAVQLAVVALAVVHPMTVVFFGVAAVSILAFRALAARSLLPVRSGALLLLPWAVPALAFLARYGFDAPGPGDLGTELQFRREFHLVDLGGGLIMGDYHMFLHPLMLAAVLASPLVWLASRRAIGNQVALAMVLGVLLVFFVPLLATPLAKAVSEQGVWRLPWLIPVPFILAYACHEAATRLLSRTGGAAAPIELPTSAWQMWAPGAVALLLLGAALFVQELYIRADGGAFYNRTSSTGLFPWTGRSIVLGGVDRAFSGNWRPSAGIEEVLDYLEANVPPSSIVLAPPPVGRFFPGVLGDVQPVDYYGAPDLFQRQVVVAGFYDGTLTGPALVDALERYGVTHVVTGAGSAAEERMQGIGAGALETLGPVVAFSLSHFGQRQGDPDLAVRGEAGHEYLAWAFDPDALEELRGPSFTVPAVSGPVTFDAIIEVAPGTDVAGEARVARVVVTLDKLDDDGKPVPGAGIHTVFQVVMEPGTRQGARVVRLRMAPGTLAAGGSYRVRVWRDGENAADTYPGDLWFLGLGIARPQDVVGERPSQYRVYRLGRGPSLTLAGFLDAGAIQDLSAGAREVLQYLRANVPAGSTVLAPPSVGPFLLETLDGIRPVDYLGAPELLQRQAMVAAFYRGDLQGAELAAALERYGVTYVVANAGTAPEEFFYAVASTATGAAGPATFRPEEFGRREGSPELIPRGQAAGEDLVWALGPNEREQLEGPAFSIPESPGPWSLDLLLEVAPGERVVEAGGVARMVITLDKLEGEAGSVSAGIHTVIDLPLEPGSERGTPILLARSPIQTFAPGETYLVRVWRDGPHEVDTYAGDVWFAGLKVAFSAYDVYRVER